MALEIDTSNLDASLDALIDRARMAVRMQVETEAATIESYAKNNRPWTDRTGDAKKRLRTEVTQPDPNTIRLTLAHGVDYGIWLELANEKRYAIVMPTLTEFGPKVIDSVRGLLNKIRG